MNILSKMVLASSVVMVYADNHGATTANEEHNENMTQDDYYEDDYDHSEETHEEHV